MQETNNQETKSTSNDQLQDIEQPTPLFKQTWFVGTVAVFLTIGLGGFVLLWNLIKQPSVEITVEPEEQTSPITKGRLQYFASIPDTENRVLGGAHEAQLYGEYMYITSLKDHGLEVLDVSDPANPELVAVVKDTAETRMQKAHTILFKDNYGYLSSSDSSAIQVFDVLNPANPVPIDFIEDDDIIGLGTVHEITIHGNYLYSAGRGDHAIAVFDISTSGVVKHVASIYDTEDTILQRPEGLVISEQNYAYVMSTREGLGIIDVSDPTNPLYAGGIADTEELNLGGLDGITLNGNHLYIVGKEGFVVFDISDPLKPIQLSSITIDQEEGLIFSNSVIISDNYAFITSESKDGAVLMLDISNPSEPIVLDVLYTNDEAPFIRGAHHLAVVGEYLYITGLQNGIGIVKFIE